MVNEAKQVQMKIRWRKSEREKSEEKRCGSHHLTRLIQGEKRDEKR